MDGYNVAFDQAATNLAAEITDEPISRSKSIGLVSRVDLEGVVQNVSCNGTRWNALV